MREETKRELAPLVSEETLEDLYFVVKTYKNYDDIFEYIINNMKDYEFVKTNQYGLLVVVAMNSINLEEFKSRVLL